MQISTDRAFIERMNDVVLIFARLERLTLHKWDTVVQTAACCWPEPDRRVLDCRHAHVSAARSGRTPCVHGWFTAGIARLLKIKCEA